jgi:hypothetical protein
MTQNISTFRRRSRVREKTAKTVYFLRKLTSRGAWNRIFYERLTEPLHLNVLAVLAYLFGSYRSKIKYDTVLREYHAFGILQAADFANEAGFSAVSVIEFGVAAGFGLMNMAAIAAKVSKLTGVKVTVYGFDTGKGMPAPRDYRDHPDLYSEGDFPMDFEKLSQVLPPNAKLFIGELTQTTEAFIAALSPDEPIGYVELDVDYYSSSKDALHLLSGPAEKYLPLVPVYLDDIFFPRHNSACGERLAVEEFNLENQMRVIEHHPFFEITRVFGRARWVRQMYYLHVLDHPSRLGRKKLQARTVLGNPYLGKDHPLG